MVTTVSTLSDKAHRDKAHRDKALASISNLPPFSPVLTKLMGTLANEDVSFAELGDLIERDPVLAGNVLRVVNSAFHARRGTVTSARHAVALLGIVKIRNLTVSLSVARMWNQHKWPSGWSPGQFNLHSVAAAMLADLAAAEGRVQFPESAFTAALLRHSGILTVAMGLPDEYARIRELHMVTGAPVHECEHVVLGFEHAELTVAMLEEWRLPAPIVDACRLEAAPTGSLAELITACDTAVDQIGLGMQDWVQAVEGEPAASLEPVLSDATDRVFAQFRAEFESMRGFFH